MLPDVAEGAAARADQVAKLKLQPIEPSFDGLQKQIEWAATRLAEHKDKADSMWTSGAWTDRHNATVAALQKHMDVIETQRSEQRGKFAAYNAWVPRANDMLSSAARLEAMQAMLGVSDPAAMVSALTQGLQEAKDLAVRTQNRFAAGEAGVASLDVPSLDASVESGEKDAAQAAKEMRASWLGLEQNALAVRAEETNKEGEADEKRLKEIEEIKKFVRNVGKTVDISLTLMEGASGAMAATSGAGLKKAGMDTAKGVGIPTSVEGVAGAITDFVYYDEIKKLKNHLNQVKARCDAISAASVAMEIRRKAEDFEAKMDGFALKCVQLQMRVRARQLAYLKLGEELDAAARNDPKSKKAGIAPPKGKERYATIMLVTSQVREILAMGDGARQAFDDPAAIQNWGLGLDIDRNNPRSLGILANTDGLTKEEWENLGKLFGRVKAFHNNVDVLHKALDPVDKAGAELIKSMSGGAGGEY
jgi:hypothetical protein